MKKRLLALLLALTMTVSLAACGSNQEPETEEDINTEAPETAVQSPEDGGEDTSAADDSAPAPSEPEVGSRPADLEGEPAGGNLPAGTTQKPESTPAQKPEPLPAEKPEDSQSRPAPSVDLAAFYETLAAGEDWPAMMQAEGEVLDAFYPGLSEITTSQCLVYTAMISAAVGEIALVEVQNGDDVQKVKDIFQARIDYQVGDSEHPGGAWYPQSIEGWKTGSRIVSNGNFVLLAVTLETSDEIVTAFNALFQ